MNGLNSGMELDDEVLFEDPVPGQVPDLIPEIKIIGEATDKIQDLNYLKHDIQNTQGMSKSFALEAEKLMPGFLNEDRLIGYFTQIPTKTLYAATLEDIEQNKKNLLVQVWEALKALVKKVIDWLQKVIAQHNEKAEAQDKARSQQLISQMQDFSYAFRKIEGLCLHPEGVADNVATLLKDKVKDPDQLQMIKDTVTQTFKDLERRTGEILERWREDSSSIHYQWLRALFSDQASLDVATLSKCSDFVSYIAEFVEKLSNIQFDPQQLNLYISSLTDKERSFFSGKSLEQLSEQTAIALAQSVHEFKEDHFYDDCLKAFSKNYQASLDYKTFANTLVPKLTDLENKINEVIDHQINTMDHSTQHYTHVNEVVKVIMGRLKAINHLLHFAFTQHAALMEIQKVLITRIQASKSAISTAVKRVKTTARLDEQEVQKLTKFLGLDLIDTCYNKILTVK